MTTDRDEQILSLSHFRDGRFADLLVIVLGLAAETHPEEVRRALGGVFDLGAVEDSHKRLALILAESQAKAADFQGRLRQAETDLGKLRDGMAADMEEMRLRLHKMHSWLTQKAKQLQPKART